MTLEPKKWVSLVKIGHSTAGAAARIVQPFRSSYGKSEQTLRAGLKPGKGAGNL
jgi:hypothetical protein